MPPSRKVFSSEAICFCVDQFEFFEQHVSELTPVSGASVFYDIMSDSLCWTDEFQTKPPFSTRNFQNFYAVLANLRTSTILGVANCSEVSSLIKLVREKAQSWSFCDNSRWLGTLDATYWRLRDGEIKTAVEYIENM